MKTTLWLSVGSIVLVCVGCGEIKPKDENALPASSNSTFAPVIDPFEPAPVGKPAAVPAPAPPPPAETPPSPPPVQQPATEDATKDGQAANEIGEGLIRSAASAYLRIPDRVVFLNIQHAMNLYKGEKGELPKTHDDFMREIIQANNIQLPELPDGSRYVYVPEQEELMIEETRN